MKIFTNGCFDVLHRGHLELFLYCWKLSRKAGWGEVIVGLNSDSSVLRLKGEGRPINNQEDRKFFLEKIKYIDKVFIFDEDTPYELIKKIQPNIIVKGGDYKKDKVVGSDLAEVKIFKYINGYSSTNLIAKKELW